METESIIIFITPTTAGNVETIDPDKWIYGYRFSGDALPPHSTPVAVAMKDGTTILHKELFKQGRKALNRVCHNPEVPSPDLLWRYGHKREASKYLSI